MSSAEALEGLHSFKICSALSPHNVFLSEFPLLHPQTLISSLTLHVSTHQPFGCPRTQRGMLMHTIQDPGVLNCCLCSHFKKGGWSNGGRGDLHHCIPLLLLIINTHPSPPAPPSSTILLPEVSGDSWPCSVAPPFTWRLEERGRNREAPAHYQYVPRGPQPPCLAAPPAAQYSCVTRPRPAGISERGVCASSCLRSLKWSAETPTPAIATIPAWWCWGDPSWRWLQQPGPWLFFYPWCSPSWVCRPRPLWEDALWLAAVHLPCCSAWSPTGSPASHHSTQWRVKMWQRCK